MLRPALLGGISRSSRQKGGLRKFEEQYMPILHASYKDTKKSAKKAIRNQSVKSSLKTETKKFLELVSSKKMDEAKKQLNHLMSQFDKARSKGIIHKNTASRKKSRLMKKLRSVSA